MRTKMLKACVENRKILSVAYHRSSPIVHVAEAALTPPR